MAYPDVPLWLDLARLARDFAWSGAAALRPRPEFSGIERYCLFIGAPRTGHSLIGSLLDAHPQMAVAHEAGVPRYLAARFSRRQVLHLLLANTRRQAARGRPHIHYSHAVAGQWQGRYRELRVIGDKHGEGFLLSAQARPWLTGAALERFDPLYFIHVVRNPYDALASVVGSSKRGQSLERAIAYFEGLYGTLERVREQLSAERLLLLRFEQFLARPRERLTETCAFLGVDAPIDYLDACVAIVEPEPEDGRDLVEWDAAALERVDRLIERHDFLTGYRFHDRTS